MRPELSKVSPELCNVWLNFRAPSFNLHEHDEIVNIAFSRKDAENAKKNLPIDPLGPE